MCISEATWDGAKWGNTLMRDGAVYMQIAHVKSGIPKSPLEGERKTQEDEEEYDFCFRHELSLSFPLQSH